MTWYHYTFPDDPIPPVPVQLYPDFIRFWNPFREGTPEEKARCRALEEQEQRDYERRLAEWEQAQAKARRLLLTLLTPEQEESLKTNEFFLVTGSRGGQYRICCGYRSENVWKLDDRGRMINGYCGGPVGNLPDGDFHLAQKLLIEADEDAFLAVANKF